MALQEKINDMIIFLESKNGYDQDLSQISYTLFEGRHHFQHRCAIVIRDREDAVYAWKQVGGKEKFPNVFQGRVDREFTGQKAIQRHAEDLLNQSLSARGNKDDYQEILYALADLYCQGYEIPWNRLDGDSQPRRISLPTYPFARKRYWIEEKVEQLSRPLSRGEDRKFEKNVSLFLNKTKDAGPNKNLSKPTGISLLDPSSTFSSDINQGTREIKKPFSTVLKEDDVLADLKSAMPNYINGIAPTLNRTGVMLERLNSYSEFFADYAGQCGGEVLDLGCAYGVATIAALERGAQVLAVDMEQQHLDILAERILDEAKQRLCTRQGLLPGIDFEEKRFAAIHASRVIHFLKPEDIRITLQKMYRWLQPGGMLFLISDTPYVGYWAPKASEYEARKAAGDSWPGYIDDVRKVFDIKDIDGAPSIINPLDPDILRRECLGGWVWRREGRFF